MELSGEYTLFNTHISTLSVYELLKHTQNGSFMENRDFQNIFPIALELNVGVFTKNNATFDFPRVSVSQIGNDVISSCSCDHDDQKLCEHQAEVIHCILEQEDFRIFTIIIFVVKY